VPRIDLWLTKGSSGYKKGTFELMDDERWSLFLECTALGSPRPGAGMANWVGDLLQPVELPPVPVDLERVVLDLGADAPAGFAGFALPEVLGEVDMDTYVCVLDDPTLSHNGARLPLTAHLLAAPGPANLRDYLLTIEDSRRPEASLRLGLLAVLDVDPAARRSADL